MNKQELELIGAEIIDSAYHVHKELGPGLLETVYEYCLIKELKSRHLTINSQMRLPIIYKGEILDKEFVIDILVQNEIIIELKAVELILPVHEVQLLTYMKLADKKLGYLINFNVPMIKQGIRRKINGYF